MSARTRRIAHVLPWPTVGDVERATVRLMGSLDRQRFESVALCRAGAPSVMRLFTDAGFSAEPYEGEEPSVRRPRRYLRALARIARRLRELRIDIVHCADLLAAYHVGPAARAAGAGLVCHVRCGYPVISRRDQFFLTPVQQWAFVSRATWAEFGMAVPVQRGTVIYDAVDTPPGASSADSAADAVTELGITTDARLVGMVARVAPVKDYETLARAAQLVIAAEPRAHFLVIGDYSSTPEYREHFARVTALLAEQGIAARFTFTGFREDVQRLVSACEIVTLVTRSEGLPLVLLEAMSVGKPVVATAVGGIPELVHTGENGLLHSPGDASALAAALLSLLRDPERARSIGRNGARYVREHHGRDSMATAVQAVYDRLRTRRGAANAPESIEAVVLS